TLQLYLFIAFILHSIFYVHGVEQRPDTGVVGLNRLCHTLFFLSGHVHARHSYWRSLSDDAGHGNRQIPDPDLQRQAGSGWWNHFSASLIWQGVPALPDRRTSRYPAAS